MEERSSGNPKGRPVCAEMRQADEAVPLLNRFPRQLFEWKQPYGAGRCIIVSGSQKLYRDTWVAVVDS